MSTEQCTNNLNQQMKIRHRKLGELCLTASDFEKTYG